MPRTYLKVPFQQKDAAKSLGAKWDATVSSWYVPEGVDTSAFTAWLSGALASIPSVPASTSSHSVAAPTGSHNALSVAKTGIPLSHLLAGVAKAVASA